MAALGAAIAAGCVSVPFTLAGWALSPDAIEHLQIAHAWVHGAGFVDAVQWAYYLDRSVPVPAFAVRPPVVPVLAALPLALGATVGTVVVLHAVWASLVVGAVVWVASRFMRLPAALAAALLFGLSPVWTWVSWFPLTEVTAVASYLLVLATVRGALRSVPGGLLCAAATTVAWLTRPSLGSLVIAVLAAIVWELGPRASLRRPAVWAYALGFTGLFALVQGLAVATSGVAVYSGYTGEALTHDEVFHYGKEYVGTWRYIEANAERIQQVLWLRVGRFGHDLFLGRANHQVGWLLLPGVLWALLRRRDGLLEHRVNAFSALGFSLVVVLNYVAFETRYAILPALCCGLCGFGMADDATSRVEARLRRRWTDWRAAVPAALLPLCAVLLFATTTSSARVPVALGAWARYRESGTRGQQWEGRRLCSWIDPDAIVATPEPWILTLFCGNATLRLPVDLEDPWLRDRFFAERHPGYFLVRRGSRFAWLATEPRVRALHRGRWEVYEVVDAPPETRPWRAPPPLVCAGREPGCAAAVETR